MPTKGCSLSRQCNATTIVLALHAFRSWSVRPDDLLSAFLMGFSLLPAGFRVFPKVLNSFCQLLLLACLQCGEPGR